MLHLFFYGANMPQSCLYCSTRYTLSLSRASETAPDSTAATTPSNASDNISGIYMTSTPALSAATAASPAL